MTMPVPADVSACGSRAGSAHFGSKQVRAALCGPSALSLKLFPLLAALQFGPALGIESSSMVAPGDLWIWVGIEFISFVALFLTFLLVKGIIRGFGIPLRPWWVLLPISGLGGVIQGLAIAQMLSITTVDDLFGPLSRAVSGFFITLLWLPIEAVVLSAIVWGRDLRDRSIREAPTVERTRLAQSDLAQVTRDAVQSALASEVQATIGIARGRFDTAVSQVHPTETIQKLLRDVAASDIRPLATELWGAPDDSHIEGSARASNSSWPRLMFANLDRRPFQPALVTFMAATFIAPVAIRNGGIEVGLTRALLLLAALFFVQSVGATLLRVTTCNHAFTVIATVIISTSLPWLLGAVAPSIYSLVLGYSRSEVPTSGLVVSALGMLFCQAVIITARAASYSREESFEVFQHQVDTELVHQQYVNAEILRESRRWATYLHGQVQSRFLAAALVLEAAQASGDPAEQTEALRIAAKVIGDIDMAPQVTVRTLMEELEFRTGLWAGLVRVTLNLPDPLTPPASVSIEAVGEVLEEGISNAYRHGRARSISVTYGPSTEGGHDLVISDDGIGPQGSRQGLGSMLLTETSGGHWALARDEARNCTILRVHLA
ncbi:MAG: hypothetical protein NTX29_04415 [Actinobacteria bacterium]|nr:hypothetical protein [Actinomycetota bacterium]